MSQKCCNDKDADFETDIAEAPVIDEVENVFRVSGADCSDEVDAIKIALASVGATAVTVNIVASTVIVRHPRKIQSSALVEAIEKTGVKVVESKTHGFMATNRSKIQLITLSGTLLSLGMILSWLKLGPGVVQFILFGASTVSGGVLVFPKAWRAILQRSLDMNVLMSVAVFGAFTIKEYSEAATVVFLFSLAELLEAFSIDRARRAIRDVLKVTPQTATKKQGNATLTVSVREVSPGDIVLVKPGESIPLDGIVKEGSSSVNQASLTGESSPVGKSVGDSVFAGTLNENGILTIQVTKAFQDTKISKMIELIEGAQESKAPSERFVDRFAKIYTPVVFIVAAVIALLMPFFFNQSFDLWFYRALVLLVVACPCALVLATPISVVSGLASLAKRGVLVKGGIHLETLGKVRTIAIDKTGTLTEGKFKVQTFRSFGGDETVALQIAASLENFSSHPLATAVLEFVVNRGLAPKSADEFKTVPGRGAMGVVDGQLYFVGNHRFTHELGVCTPDLENYLSEQDLKALSVVVVGHAPHDGHDGLVLGVFALGDSLRKNAKAAVLALHNAGIKKVIILSGDNQKTVDAIKALSGVDEGYGDLLPEDKVKKIQELARIDRNIAMVGDGINDAPALAHASIGISMGAAGTDTAIETSDIALMQDNLEELPKAILQGRRVLNVIRFNIAFAIALKLIFIVLAISGISNLWLAVAADMGASIFVIANALRLLQ